MFSSAGEDPDREKAITKWWEQYGQISGKISRLLEFGEKKGFDYDQILDSKLGISIAGEIVTLYKNEVGSSSF